LFRRRPGSDDWERLDPAKWDGADRKHRNWFLGGLTVAGPKDGWAVLFSAAEAGVVLHTADGGDTWQALWTADADLFHVHFADAGRGWLAGSGGKLWATEDGGRQWTAQENPAGVDPVSTLAFARREPSGIAPLLDGRALWTDDGRTWKSVETGLKGGTPAAAVVDAGRAYVLAQNGWIARFTDPTVRPRR
jgi:photosystem II stability/assembly factor-like uncharacterized protein